MNEKRNTKVKNLVMILVMAVSLVSCSKDDNPAPENKTGTLKVEFESTYAGEEFEFGNTAFTTSQNEVLNIGNVKYIISNIVLTNEDGTTFVYPKEQSYFIVNGSEGLSTVLALNNIPAGHYKAIKFGVGVDKAQYDLGQNGQGSLWTAAQAAGLAYDWSEGYKFVSFVGTYTSPTVTTAHEFMVEMSKTDADYNYQQISLSLPSNASVGGHVTPQIHISADLSQIIDGTNKINLASTDGMIMGGWDSDQISANVANMFVVEHVHSD